MCCAKYTYIFSPIIRKRKYSKTRTQNLDYGIDEMDGRAIASFTTMSTLSKEIFESKHVYIYHTCLKVSRKYFYKRPHSLFSPLVSRLISCNYSRRKHLFYSVTFLRECDVYFNKIIYSINCI